MAKAKRYYYECIAGKGASDVRNMGCDVAYMGPDQRKERWGPRGQPMCMHSIRVFPSKGYNARGQELPPDYIVTDRPLAKQYTEAMEKKVSRPRFDPATGRRNGRVYRKKVTSVKFRKLDDDEVDRDVRSRSYDKDWVDAMFVDSSKVVDLPAKTAIMDRSAPIDSAEPEDLVPSGEEVIKAKGN